MTQGLTKLTAIANNQQAWLDWLDIKRKAEKIGHGFIAAELTPPEGSSWKVIDKQIGLLRKATGLENYVLPSAKRKDDQQ